MLAATKCQFVDNEGRSSEAFRTCPSDGTTGQMLHCVIASAQAKCAAHKSYDGPIQIYGSAHVAISTVAVCLTANNEWLNVWPP